MKGVVAGISKCSSSAEKTFLKEPNKQGS